MAETCPSCTSPLYRIQGLCTDRDGIREDRWCETCQIVWGSRAHGLVRRCAGLAAPPATEDRGHVEDVWGEPVEGGRYFKHTHGPGRDCDYDCGGGWVPAPRAAKEPATRLPPLSEEARKAREPLPPHALLAAESAPILPTPGRAGTPIPLPRAAKEGPTAEFRRGVEAAAGVLRRIVFTDVCGLGGLKLTGPERDDWIVRATARKVIGLAADEIRSLSPAPAAPEAPTDACDVCKTLRPHGYLVPAGDGRMICPSCAPAPEASPDPDAVKENRHE